MTERPRPRRLGHLVLKVRDIEASLAFYRDIVGLEVSDWIGSHMVFLRAGTDHHDLALLQLPPGHGPAPEGHYPAVEHFSYLVDGIEEVRAMARFLKEKDIEIDRGVGRHGPGGNTFIVFKDPDGNNVEFYSDMIQVSEDKPHVAEVWDGGDLATFDQWGLTEFVVAPPARIQQMLDKTGKCGS